MNVPRMDQATVWLTQNQLPELFQTTWQSVDSTFKMYFLKENWIARQVTRTVENDNLAAIISVDYRVKSHHGRQFLYLGNVAASGVHLQRLCSGR